MDEVSRLIKNPKNPSLIPQQFGFLDLILIPTEKGKTVSLQGTTMNRNNPVVFFYLVKEKSPQSQPTNQSMKQNPIKIQKIFSFAVKAFGMNLNLASLGILEKHLSSLFL